MKAYISVVFTIFRFYFPLLPKKRYCYEQNYDRRNFVKLATGTSSEKSDPSGEPHSEAVSSQTRSGSKTIRLGFIGLGGRGSYHLNCALGIEGIEVPAICEPQPVRIYQAKRWIEAAGCRHQKCTRGRQII